MRAGVCLFAAIALCPGVGSAQAIPGHEQDGPAEICGITAQGALEFEAKVRADDAYREQDRNALYVLFSADDGLRQWAFATRDNPAYPAATCRRITRDDGGNLHSSRRIACEGPKIECDRVYLQFKSVDERLNQALRKD